MSKKQTIIDLLSKYYTKEYLEENMSIFYINVEERLSEIGKKWGWEDSERFEVPNFCGWVDSDELMTEIIETAVDTAPFIAVMTSVDALKKDIVNILNYITCIGANDLGGTQQGDIFVLRNAM